MSRTIANTAMITLIATGLLAGSLTNTVYGRDGGGEGPRPQLTTSKCAALYRERRQLRNKLPTIESTSERALIRKRIDEIRLALMSNC